MRSKERVACRVGAVLRDIRERHHRKQYLVAEQAGITRGMLSAYERGRQCPSVPTLAKVLAVLDCSVEEFGRLVGPWRCFR